VTITKFAFPVALFVAGLSVGALWSPLSGFWQIPEEGRDTQRSRAVSDAQLDKRIAEWREQLGEEVGRFAEQAKDMTIRIKKYPIDAGASPDGRFIIHVFGNAETMASDLLYPGKGDTLTELVRHYSFSCGDQTYSCDFGRSVEDGKMTSILFSCEVKGETTVTYLDLDGDGRWDRFTDYTETPPNGYSKTYEREGLCWKRLMIGDPKSENESDGKGRE
jgi:hypothetical protein